MQFVTFGNRIATENFNIGFFYKITFTDSTEVECTCIGIGANFVSFQRQEPELLFTLTLDNAATVLSIDFLGGGGTSDYEELDNLPKINNVELIGNKTSSDLGLQAELTETQLNAINSGITSTDVAQIETNKTNISLTQRQTNNTYKTIDIATDMTFLSTGYIKSNGDIGTANSNAVYYMTLGSIRELTFDFNTVLSSGTGLAKLTDSGGTLKKVYINKKTAHQTITIENGQPTDILYVTFYDYQSEPTTYYNSIACKDYTPITTAYYTELEAMIAQSPVYYNTVAKPLDFSSKKLQFFGDSITYGYIDSNTRANPTYPDSFGAAVGATTIINSGVSDSTFATVTGHTTILSAIQSNLDTTADFVFVAGGINDWQNGVDDTTLRTAVQAVCTYLASNYTGTVILITPINHGGKTPTETPTQTLDSVRRGITEIALTNGFNVVQGWQFPFPNVGANADYISAMYADLLHPTQTGYNIYAKALETALI